MRWLPRKADLDAPSYNEIEEFAMARDLTPDKCFRVVSNLNQRFHNTEFSTVYLPLQLTFCFLIFILLYTRVLGLRSLIISISETKY